METDFRIYLFEEVEIYLIEIGEFMPFAIKVVGDKFNSVSYYPESNESEVIDSLEVLDVLKDKLSNDIKSGSIDKAYIAANTSITYNGKAQDAVMVLDFENGIDWKEHYYPYKMANGKFEKWGL